MVSIIWLFCKIYFVLQKHRAEISDDRITDRNSVVLDAFAEYDYLPASSEDQFHCLENTVRWKSNREHQQDYFTITPIIRVVFIEEQNETQKVVFRLQKAKKESSNDFFSDSTV